MTSRLKKARARLARRASFLVLAAGIGVLSRGVPGAEARAVADSKSSAPIPAAAGSRPSAPPQTTPAPEATSPLEATSTPVSPGSPGLNAAHDTDPVAAGRMHALLLNGGGAAVKNYLSHFHHLQDMVAALRARGIPPERIDVFSADGEDPGKDLAARGSEPPDFWLVDGTSQGRTLNTPDLTNTTWEGVTLRPARLRDLRRWFTGAGNAIPPGDTLLVFVTDHGNKNTDDPDNGTISLWNGSLSVLEFRALLGYLQPGVRVISVMSQCYSGAFADAMTPLHSRIPGGDVCGFYSTTSDRAAYGCYAEGRDRDRIGHAFRFIDAMSRHSSTDDVHAAVLVTDSTPDVPIRTSDLFLERVLEDEASRSKIALDDLVDRQLSSAWKNRGRWEREIRLLDRIGEVYGTFSPRTLSELKPRVDSLQSLSKDLTTYEDRWNVALDDVRKANMERFLDDQPSWKEKLDPKKLEVLDDAGRKSLLLELLPALKEFTKGRPDVWTRLQDLRATDEDADSAKYRTEIRLAALMRMRTLLVRIAGMQLLDTGASVEQEDVSGTARNSDKPRSGHDLPGDKAPNDIPREQPRWSELRQGLANLQKCEKEPIGALDPRDETGPALESPSPLPPLEQDLAAVSRALPSWFGVRFRPVNDAQREKLHVERGATLIEQVYPDTPASTSGIQASDIVLGPPGAHFSEPNQIREWTMSSPRDKVLTLDLLREGEALQIQVTLAPYPAQMPALPPPPQAGDQAPPLDSLKMVRSGKTESAVRFDSKNVEPPPSAPKSSQPEPPASSSEASAPPAPNEPAQVPKDETQRAPAPRMEADFPGPKDDGTALSGRRHMLFFWATWCAPCKASVTELMAWSRQTGVPIVAVSDEDEPTVRKFLESWTRPFPELVASDELRKSHVGYGVSGTPTFVLVDAHGKIEWRQVGYSPKDHLGIPGWSWSGKSP